MKASYQCIRLWLRCVVFIVITGYFHVLITSQTMSEEWACLVLLDLVLRHWPLGLQTKFSVCGLLVCMYVCVCVRFALRYHYALLYQGFSVEQVIFLDISSCSEPETRAMQILRERESIWSNSNTDAAPVDLSIFVSLPLLLWTVLRSTVSSCFFNRYSRWRMF